MKKVFVVSTCLLMSVCAIAQDTVIPITSFENFDEAWAYSGGNVTFSQVEELPTEIPQIDGPNALYVSYDNAGSTWQWANFNWPITLDISGMREIHMWVYWMPTTGDRKSIRLDLSGGIGLGTRNVAEANKWTELVWPITRFTSPTLTAVNYWGGFISPDEADNAGELYIDNITAVRKANTPSEFEEITVFNFDEEDDVNLAPKGFQMNASNGFFELGTGEATPTEGANYAVLYAGNAWTNYLQSTDARALFDRWGDVVDIQLDVQVPTDFVGGWVQWGLVFQSGGPEGTENVNGWDSYPEQGFVEAKGVWKTLVWQVDMSKHAGALSGAEGTWFQLVFTLNNDAASDGQPTFMDNLRVGVGKQSGTDVSTWSLY